MKKVLLAANISEAFKSLLIKKGYELVIYEGGEVPTDVIGIVTSTKLSLGKAQLVKLDRLKWIARLGSGIEIIDTTYCEANNIAFASSPAGIANAVAEHCVAMLISMQKNITSSFLEIKNREWIREPNRGWEIEGKTIGIIGYGFTGKAFAQKIKSFGCRILAYDKYQNDFGDTKVLESSLEDLQKEADVISFHLPLNTETKHYYNDKFIANCKEHILINASRGDIVNTASLLSGLHEGKVLAAALDVLENERELGDKNSLVWDTVEKLLGFNVLLTPHIAGYSHNAVEKMSAELIEKLEGAI